MPAGLGVAVEGLDAAYGSVPVLRGVSLHVGAGEILALLGPSGCGKTTLLRCIAGLETPTAGRIVIGDRDVTFGRGVPAEKRRVGMVFQEGALFPHKTVAGNVGYGVPRGRLRDERSTASLRLVGLGDKAGRMPGTLSGGEQQRVALARALAPEPGVILLDEPFSSLDAGLRWQLRSDVRRLLKGIGVTTVLVTHDQDEALTFGDHVAVMRAGTIEQVGTPADVYGRPATPWVATFVGEANLLDASFANGSATTALGTLPSIDAAGAGRVLCRPEQLRLEAGGAATTTGAAYFGRDTRYEVEVPGAGILVVRTPGPPEHAAGDAVSVRFSARCAHGWVTAAGPATERY
jgi:iron(III) transport system ATP-binding protein